MARYLYRAQTGLTTEQAVSELAGKVGAPALGGLLSDPALRAQISGALASALRDPTTRAALRPILVEAAVAVGGGVLVALLVYKAFTR